MIQRNNDGFTLIELLVTLLLGTALIIAFFNLYRIGVNLNTSTSRQELARNIAYRELRKYSQVQAVDWTPNAFICDSNTDKVSTAGQTIKPATSVVNEGLPNPATVTVKALAPYGCSGSNTDMPLMIEVTVLYGVNNQKAIYTSYAKR